MGKLKNLFALCLSISCAVSLLVPINSKAAETDEILANETFGDTDVPEKFKYIEEKGTSLKVSDGKLIYERPNNINDAGGFWYDLSSVGDLSDLHCNKLIFEYDAEYKDIKRTDTAWYWKAPVILDESGKAYLDTYIETSSEKTIFCSKQGYPSGEIKVQNAAEENKNIYYKIRVTVDILNSKQKFEYAEMTSGSTALPDWKTFGEKAFYESTDGTLGKFYFVSASNWNNITLTIDNFKITKSEPWEEMRIKSVSPQDGFEFKSNKPEIIVEFTNALDEKTISEITLEDENEKEVKTNKSISGNKVTLSPEGYLTYSSKYFLKIGAGIKDTIGQSIVSGGEYSYTTMSDPTDRNGTIYAKDTFEDATTISNYTWTDDKNTTVEIDGGVLKFNRKQAGSAGYVNRKLDIEAGEELVVIEYDFYPIKQRNDDASAWNFKNPGVYDDAGKAYLEFYTQPTKIKENNFTLVAQGGSTLDTQLKFGTDYCYHVTLVLDRKDGKYRAVYEENNLNTGDVRTINCPWTAFRNSEVNGSIAELCFSGGHAWGYAEHNYDNLVVYKPGKMKFVGASVEDGEKDVAATEEVELEFGNCLSDNFKEAVTLKDENQNEIKCNMSLTNNGRSIKLIPEKGRFEYLTNYTISVKKDGITDIFGQKCNDEIEISFKTAKIPTAKIQFKNAPTIELKTKNDTVTKDIKEAEKAVAEILDVENISENPDSKRDVVLIAGLYDKNGNLKKYALEVKTLSKGDKKNLKTGLLLENIEDGDTVRVFCWDGIPGAPYKTSK